MHFKNEIILPRIIFSIAIVIPLIADNDQKSGRRFRLVKDCRLFITKILPTFRLLVIPTRENHHINSLTVAISINRDQEHEAAYDNQYAKAVLKKLVGEAWKEAVEEVPVQAGPSRCPKGIPSCSSKIFKVDVMLRFRFSDNLTFTQGFKYSATLPDVHKFDAEKRTKNTESFQLAKYPNDKLQLTTSDISSAGSSGCCVIIVEFKLRYFSQQSQLLNTFPSCFRLQVSKLNGKSKQEEKKQRVPYFYEVIRSYARTQVVRFVASHYEIIIRKNPFHSTTPTVPLTVPHDSSLSRFNSSESALQKSIVECA